jgi:penicillin-binding protein 1C
MKVKVIKKKKHRLSRKRLFLIGLLILPLVIAFGVFYYFILRDLPSPSHLSVNSLGQSTQIYDRNGVRLYTIYDDRNQTFVKLADIPRNLRLATLMAEDKDFYKHGAIDLRGIVRAGYATIFKKSLQGGSTLTQQLVKNSLLSPERTVQRKIKEVILSFATEALYSKDQIMEMYLNQVPYGGTAYGVQAASRMYFGKDVEQLTLAESALLAGLPESPSTYAPFGSRPELGKVRQEYILERLRDEGYITEAERNAAAAEEITFKSLGAEIKAPHFVFYVKDLLVQKYGERLVKEGGLQVRTSLDLSMQEFAQQTVASEVAKLKNYHVSNGAALITNPATGEVLAMVGSRDYFDTAIDGNVNVTLAHLQPGSSIKPINYAVGLMKGYSAATPFIDKPTCFPGKPAYCPKNYDNTYHGVVSMRQALGNSLNIPAVQMLKVNGLDAMIATASAMGITTFQDPSRYGLSLTLGGGEVTMTDMATAFSVFANRGYRIDLHPILKVTDKTGAVLEEYRPPASPIFGQRVLPPGVAFIISDILQDNTARQMAFGPNSELRIPGQTVSVKTGTTNDYRDNWTIGYTPSLLVATWVGNNDHTPMSGIVSGVTGAAPIWHKLIAHFLEGKTPEKLTQPSDVVSRAVCVSNGGQPPAQGCQTRREYFLKNVAAKQPTTRTEKVFVDKATGDLAAPGQTENVEEKDETILIDSLGNKYCLSCPHPTPTPTPGP